MSDATVQLEHAPSGLTKCRICARGSAAPADVIPGIPLSLWPTSAPPHPVFALELYVCEQCAHVQLQNMPETLVSRLYDDGVFVEDNSAGHHDRLTAYLRHFGADALADARVLDVGGGNNPFVGHLCATSERWISDIVITDTARRSTEVAVEGLFAQAELPTAYFDLVTLFHTLEHFAEPGSAVARLAQIVRPGGRVFLEVPNAPIYAKAVPHYAVIHQHQSYFHRGALNGLMARYGFEATHYFVESTVLLAAFTRTDREIIELAQPDPAVGYAVAAYRRATMERVDALVHKRLENVERVAFYGAGGSLTMFLSLLPWVRDRLIGVFDRDTKKHGRYVPGTWVRVDPPAAADACEADRLLFLSSPLHRQLTQTYHTETLDIGTCLAAAALSQSV